MNCASVRNSSRCDCTSSSSSVVDSASRFLSDECSDDERRHHHIEIDEGMDFVCTASKMEASEMQAQCGSADARRTHSTHLQRH